MRNILLKTTIILFFVCFIIFIPSTVKAVLCDIWDSGEFTGMSYGLTTTTITINGRFNNGLCLQNCSSTSKRVVADPIGQLKWFINGNGITLSGTFTKGTCTGSNKWCLETPSSPISCIPYPSVLFGEYGYWIKDAVVDISSLDDSLPTGTYTFTLKLQAYAEPGRYFETSHDFTITIDKTDPTCSIHYQCNSGYSSCTDATSWTNSSTGYLKLDEADVGSGIKSGIVHRNTMPQGGSWSGWGGFTGSNTINNFSTALSSDCTYYRFRYQVTDNANNVSAWSDPGWQLKVDRTNPGADISYPCNSSFTGCVNSTTWHFIGR